MSLTGRWINDYRSVMTLEQDPTGFVFGDYASSTGSTGRYHVLGYASPSDPTARLGQPVALSICWRSHAGGPGDESWHWVSGLAGQLQSSPAPACITLMHAMVAATAYPGFVTPGTWVDKLVYVPDKDAGSIPGPITRPLRSGAVTGAITGTWVCQASDATLTLTQALQPFGRVDGLLTLNGRSSFAVVGFTDAAARSRGITLQALSVSGCDTLGNRCFALAGSLDIAADTITLTVYATRATPPDQTYVQTRVETWRLTRS